MDPATGRFLSEDPAGQGDNWLVYCGDDPVNKVDSTGTMSNLARSVWATIAAGLTTGAIIGLARACTEIQVKAANILLVGAAFAWAMAAVGLPDSFSIMGNIANGVFALKLAICTLGESTSAASKTYAWSAAAVLATEGIIEIGLIASIGADTGGGGCH